MDANKKRVIQQISRIVYNSKVTKKAANLENLGKLNKKNPENIFPIGARRSSNELESAYL